jgi:16S rRNA processing protein RimM
MQVVIGRIGRPHGIRGDVMVEPRTDEPEIRFAPGAAVEDEQGRTLIVESSGLHSGRLRVKFLGIDDRDGAEGLRGRILHIERADDARPDDPDEFYDTELIGMRAILLEGSEVGVVRDVLHLPGQDLLAIDHDGREVLVPFVADFVPSVNLAARVITLTPPPGLLDS